jgi:peptidoglycan/LPS O-acetylase OafA/YrhL
MKETSVLNNQHYHQLDALRGVAALMVVINHFILLGPLFWIIKSPLRVMALGHEAVIFFFELSGFVLALQLRSSRRVPYRDYLIKRICRIYLPYLAVLIVTFSIVDAITVRTVNWAGGWFNQIWSGPFTGTEIVDHLIFIGRFKASQMIPVIWSLIYEARISLIMPLVVFLVAQVSARTALLAALAISVLSFVLLGIEGGEPFSANFDGDWPMTLHYLGMFIVGSTLAIHRASWRQWLMKDGRTRIVFAISVVLYFTSRSVLSITMSALGQCVFDWLVAAGTAGLISTSLVSARFASVLAWRPIAFLGMISYSLYLTHAVVLLTVVHLMPSADSMWRTIVTATLLVVPVATVVHFAIERPAMMLGQFLTLRRGRTAAAQRANQPF